MLTKTIYITRLSAFQIQCGGLDRLQVWFSQPHYSEPYYFKEIDDFTGSQREIGCYAKQGWQVSGGKTQQSVSFGGLFGYENDLSDFVWSKLQSHFGNTEFLEWHNYEKEYEECCIKNFFLKIDLNITANI